MDIGNQKKVRAEVPVHGYNRLIVPSRTIIAGLGDPGRFQNQSERVPFPKVNTVLRCFFRKMSS